MSGQMVNTNDLKNESIELAPSVGVGMVSTRAAQEVQAAMVVAKNYPRDETRSLSRILQSCKRMSLAEVSQYEYPRGGTAVTGPSIRLAEAIAQNWGNIDFGIIELENSAKESTVMSYAWDLETNTRSTKVFSVSHVRVARSGRTQLTDPRDVYENLANYAARRMRACIMAVIPGDVFDLAVAECNKTLAGDGTEPLVDKIRRMVGAFGELGVSQADLETRLGHNVDAITLQGLVTLRNIYQSLKDGMSKPEDWFKTEGEGRVKSEPQGATAGDFGATAEKEATETEQPDSQPLSVVEEIVAQVEVGQTLKAVRQLYDEHVGPESKLDGAGRTLVTQACEARSDLLRQRNKKSEKPVKKTSPESKTEPVPAAPVDRDYLAEIPGAGLMKLDQILEAAQGDDRVNVDRFDEIKAAIEVRRSNL